MSADDREERLREELRFHLEMDTAELERRGLDPAEARRRAGIRLGSVERFREEMREVNGIGRLERLTGDLRFGLRMLRSSRLLTLVALLTLALGIGASTAIFSVVDGILLRSLPFAEPDRLVTLWVDLSERGGPVREWLSYETFHDARQLDASFESLAIWSGWGPTLTGRGEAEQLNGGRVSHGYFEEVLRLAPALGRGFQADDDQPGAPPVVLLSHGLWQRRFGGDREAVGAAITLDGEPHVVAGVMPPGFRQPFAPATEIWSLFRWSPTDHPGSRGSAFLRAIGRLAPGATLESARVEVDALGQRLEEEYPESNAKTGLVIFPLKDDVVLAAKTGLWVLLGAVIAVLMMVCVNLANLLLARGASRRGEIALRTALGASGRRIVAQLLTESVLLASVGGALGIAVAYWLTGLLVRLAPPGTPRIEEVAVDLRVLVFAIAVTVLSGLLFGLAPALRAARPDLTASLHEGDRSGASGPAAGALQRGLVIAQVALALILLVGAGLLLRSFHELNRLDLGFRPEGLVSFFLSATPDRYPEIEQAVQFYEQVEERLAALPGVERVSSISSLPMAGFDGDSNFFVEGRPDPPPDQENVSWIRRVTPGYFETMEIEVVAGRALGEQDHRDAVPVVVVNETLARRYFGDASPLGERLNVNDPQQPVWREIVGVVSDVRNFGVRAEPRPATYFPYHQLPTRRMFVVARASGDPEALVAPARRELAEIDPAAAPQVQTVASVLSASLATDRFLTLILALFAAVALQLAAVGLYGVVSYGVSRRVREIGVRLALGARASEIGRSVVGSSLRTAALGVGIGVAGAAALTRWMRGLLFETSAWDPITFALVATVMTVVAAIAATTPALRAARVDPSRVLRSD